MNFFSKECINTHAHITNYIITIIYIMKEHKFLFTYGNRHYYDILILILFYEPLLF